MNFVEKFKYRKFNIETKLVKLTNGQYRKVSLLNNVSPKCITATGELVLPPVDVVRFDAFENVKDLVESIHIPETIIVIDTKGYLYPFAYLNNLTTIEVNSNNPVFFTEQNHLYKKIYEKDENVFQFPVAKDLMQSNKNKCELVFDGSNSSVYTAPENFEYLKINNGAFLSNNEIVSAEIDLKPNAIVEINPAEAATYSTINQIIINEQAINLELLAEEGALICEFKNINNMVYASYIQINNDEETSTLENAKKTIPIKEFYKEKNR